MLFDPFDRVGDDLDLARADPGEQIRVGNQANPLVPGIIARFEMRIDRIVGRKLLHETLADELFHRFRTAPRKLEKKLLHEHVAPADQAVACLCTEQAAKSVGDFVDGRAADHVGRRALQHDDLRSGLGHDRNDRHCSRAASDDDDLLPRIVEPLGPELGMKKLSGEAVAASELGQIGLFIVVIARTHVEPIGGECLGRSGVASFDLDGPGRGRAVEVGPANPAVEADMAAQVVLVGDPVDVVEDRRPVGDCLGLGPRLERITKRVHVAVGPDPGVAEQIPRPANRGPAFEDCKAFARSETGQMPSGPDARNSRSDDQHVEVGGRFGGRSRRLLGELFQFGHLPRRCCP